MSLKKEEKMSGFFQKMWVLLIFILCHVCIAQQDNGNHFEKTWAAPDSLYTGHWGELGVYAEEGLDIDQNGKREFVIYDHIIGFVRYDHLQVWEARGDNDFQLAWQVRYDDYQSQNQQGHGLTVADIDFDGKKEVWIATEGKIYIYEWDGTTFESGGGLPSEPTQTLYTVLDTEGKSCIRQLRIANLDADPELEFFMGYSYTAGIYCVIGSLVDSDLSNPEWKIEYADDFEPWKVGGMTIDDFDGDGNMEIFTCHPQDESVTRLYESDGADNYVVKFTTTASTLALVPSFDDAVADPVFHDFDGDGKNEMVIADIHGKVFIITHDASNGFTDFGSSAWSYLMNLPDVKSHGFVRSGILADLDQDGKDDIYYNDMTAKAVLDLEYQSGPVTDPASWHAYKIYTGHPLIIGYISPAWDLDGDGKQELVIAGSGEPTENLQVIENQDATSVRTQIASTPDRFIVEQNYPNPFNPGTNIQYSIANPGTVEIRIFNMIGEEVLGFETTHDTPGMFTYHWDGRDITGTRVPSGMYLYRITHDGISLNKKMILQK
ncbi:T9SS type A sorting domain-containing protein [candidate division KSB1 bacterium]|nr:T9SS type A sorting domain-containing protein [candidate division KSB1 bacterium]